MLQEQQWGTRLTKPLAFKQHQYPNPCQKHLEFQKSLLPKFQPGPQLLNYCVSQTLTSQDRKGVTRAKVQGAKTTDVQQKNFFHPKKETRKVFLFFSFQSLSRIFGRRHFLRLASFSSPSTLFDLFSIISTKKPEIPSHRDLHNFCSFSLSLSLFSLSLSFAAIGIKSSFFLFFFSFFCFALVFGLYFYSRSKLVEKNILFFDESGSSIFWERPIDGFEFCKNKQNSSLATL